MSNGFGAFGSEVRALKSEVKRMGVGRKLGKAHIPYGETELGVWRDVRRPEIWKLGGTNENW